MSERETQVMERIGQNLKKLTERERERVMDFTDGMAFQAHKDAAQDRPGA